MLPATDPRVRRPRRGFTLLEVMLSAALLALVMGGATSAILIAAKGIDGSATNAVRARTASEVLDQVAADLQAATAFTERTATAVTFTVPDRNGDGQPETLRYAWSGVAGDPLTRSVNGGTAVSMANGVNAFNLNLSSLSFTPLESQEMVLASYDHSTGASSRDFNLDGSHLCAAYFAPSLPVNAVAWKITRVKFVARQKDSPTGTLAVEIRTASSGGLPTTTVIGSQSLSETALLVAYAWTEVQFSNLSGLNPASGCCLVIRQPVSGGSAATINYEQNGSAMNANACWLTSGNSGGSWSAPNTTQEMRFYVYGTVSTQGPPLWP